MFFDPSEPPGDVADDACASVAEGRSEGWDDGWGQGSADEPDDVAWVSEVVRLRATLAAQQYVRVDTARRAALADGSRYGAGPAQLAERSLRLELAAELRMTESAVQRMFSLADALVHRYPGALDALACAQVTERHVEILVELLDPLDAPLREWLTEKAVSLAVELPVGSFRRALRRLIDLEQSVTRAERHEQTLAGRRVVLESAEDAMAWLHAYLPAVEAHAAWGPAHGDRACDGSPGGRDPHPRTGARRRAR